MASLALRIRRARESWPATRLEGPIRRVAGLLICLSLGAACEAGHDRAARGSPDDLSATSSAGASVPVRQSFHMEVPAPPVPVAMAGTRRLVYELHLLSFASGPLTLERVEILDAADGTVLTELTGEAVGHRLSSLASPSPDAGPSALAPGTLGIVYLEIELEDDALPRALEHRLRYRDDGEASTTLAMVQGARTPVRPERPVVLSPPVRGGPWVAVYHPSWERGHRRVVYAIDGRARIPGRFAVDWFKVDSLGRHAGPVEDRVSDWYGHGVDALAVADGVVAGVRTDLPESATLSAHTRPTLEDASGNYVVLDVGDGRYAFYEHLQPGSIRVRPGDRVARGQVIASLGFTGSAAGPHLHFHVADADSPLAAEGLPFVLEAFEMLGSYATSDIMTGVAWRPADGAGGGRRTDELPVPNAVVDFGPGG